MKVSIFGSKVQQTVLASAGPHEGKRENNSGCPTPQEAGPHFADGDDGDDGDNEGKSGIGSTHHIYIDSLSPFCFGLMKVIRTCASILSIVLTIQTARLSRL